MTLRLKSSPILIITLLALLFVPRSIFSQEMSSQNFVIQGGNLNMTSGNKSSTNFKLSDSVGQLASGTFASKGFIINAGFLNSAAGSIFGFSVNPNLADFGALIPRTPQERVLTLKITNGDVPGYIVSVSEDQTLSTSVGSHIPDIRCDKSAPEACIYSQAGPWTSNEIFGFGYRLSGKTVPADFDNVTYYRPFSASTRNEKAIPVMQSKAHKVVDSALMNLKVNVSQNQPVGLYRNVLSFVAIPGI